MEDTRHHVKEEENEMFPMVRDQFSREALEELGERMEAEKVKFQKAKRITPRRPQPKGVVEKVMDKARAVAGSVMPGGKNGFAKKAAKRSPAAKAKLASKAKSSGSRAAR